MSGILLEVCVDGPAGLAAAIEGGADRVELCSALSLGGLTPSAGFMAAAAAAPVPVYAMIRPRAGGFAYSQDELDVMARDIEEARQAGLAGVVFGVCTDDGSLDFRALKRLAALADGLGTTLHRVFDLVADRVEAIEMAAELGFERILTSGGARTAPEGVETLEEAVAVAAGRISIMPGAGIDTATVDGLLPRLRVDEVHASCSTSETMPEASLLSLGFSSAKHRRTDAARVRALKARIAAVT